MLRNVHLYGSIADLAGAKTIDLDVDTPIMLMSGLFSQVEGFRAWAAENKLGLILTDSSNVPLPLSSLDDYRLPLGNATDIHVLPETYGAGTELIALISMTLEVSWITATVIYVIANIAVGFVLGAIAQALGPSPDTSAGGAKVEERPSFLYNGPINVREQGYAVPLVYGTHMTGSIVVSAGVSVEDIPYVPTTPASASVPAEDYQWSNSQTGGGY